MVSVYVCPVKTLRTVYGLARFVTAIGACIGSGLCRRAECQTARISRQPFALRRGALLHVALNQNDEERERPSILPSGSSLDLVATYTTAKGCPRHGLDHCFILPMSILPNAVSTTAPFKITVRLPFCCTKNADSSVTDRNRQSQIDIHPITTR